MNSSIPSLHYYIHAAHISDPIFLTNSDELFFRLPGSDRVPPPAFSRARSLTDAYGRSRKLTEGFDYDSTSYDSNFCGRHQVSTPKKFKNRCRKVPKSAVWCRSPRPTMREPPSTNRPSVLLTLCFLSAVVDLALLRLGPRVPLAVRRKRYKTVKKR